MELLQVKPSEFDGHVDFIRSLLNISSQTQAVTSVLQWTLGHNDVRPLQLSGAWYSLSPKMHWELIASCGPISFDEIQTIADPFVQHDQISLHDQLGFFNPIPDFAQADDEFARRCQRLGFISALKFGEMDSVDGLLLLASEQFIDEADHKIPLLHVRFAAEFIYAKTKEQFYQNQSVADSLNNPTPVNASLPSDVGQVQVIKNQVHPATDITLTPRQQVVLQLIAEGATNEEIAERMHLSIGTIRVETSRLYERLGARNRQQAATFAYLVDSAS